MKCFKAMPWKLHLMKTRLPKPGGTPTAPTRNTGIRDQKRMVIFDGKGPTKLKISRCFPLLLAILICHHHLQWFTVPKMTHPSLIRRLLSQILEGIFFPQGVWPPDGASKMFHGNAWRKQTHWALQGPWKPQNLVI